MAVLDLALLFHKTNSQPLRVFPERWGMSPPLRLTEDSCPYQMPAAINPTSSLQLQLSSEHYGPEGITSVISAFPVHHPSTSSANTVHDSC